VGVPEKTEGPMRELIAHYLKIKANLIEQGYAREIDWQEERDWAQVSECDFLREAAWVVLCSGFSERAVRGRVARFSSAFREWNSASAILSDVQGCRRAGLSAFNNPAKVDAIIKIVETIDQMGFESVRQQCGDSPIEFLTALPYLGPATSRHLAKNLGLAYSKPDRHVVRAALAAGYVDADDLCLRISCALDEPVGVVDIVIWRNALVNADHERGWRRIARARSNRRGAQSTGRMTLAY
jgi:hypothetical protein